MKKKQTELLKLKNTIQEGINSSLDTADKGICEVENETTEITVEIRKYFKLNAKIKTQYVDMCRMQLKEWLEGNI